MEPSSSISNSNPASFRSAWWIWIAWVLVVFAGDRLGAYLLGRVVLHSGTRFSVLYSGRITPGSVVAIGNSRGVNAFSPAVLSSRLGVPCVNLSYNGMSLRVGDALLRDLVDQGGRPRLVMIELSAVGADMSLLNELRMYEPWSPRLRELDAANWPRAHTVSRFCHLYAFNGEMLSRNAYYLRHSDQDWVNRYVMTPEALQAQRVAPPLELSSRPEELRALGELVRWLDGRHIPVMLVIGPYLPEYRARIANYDVWLAELRGELGGHPVLDYSQAIQDRSLFADELHINAEGTARLSALLAESCAKSGLGAASP